MAKQKYKVKAKDTLSSLGNPQKILALNPGLTNLSQGQSIYLPAEPPPPTPNPMQAFMNFMQGSSAVQPTGNTNMAVAPRGVSSWAQNYAYSPFPTGMIGTGMNSYAGYGEEQANGGAQKVNPSMVQQNQFAGGGIGGNIPQSPNTYNTFANPLAMTNGQTTPLNMPSFMTQAMLPNNNTNAMALGQNTVIPAYNGIPQGYNNQGTGGSGSAGTSVGTPASVYSGGNTPEAIAQRAIWNQQAGASPERAMELAINPPVKMTKGQVWEMKAAARRRRMSNGAVTPPPPATMIGGNGQNVNMSWRVG